MNSLFQSLEFFVSTDIAGWFFDVVIKATLILTAAILANRMLQSASAAVRHRVWCMSFIALLALPILAAVLPALRLPLLPPSQSTELARRGTDNESELSDALPPDRSGSAKASTSQTDTAETPSAEPTSADSATANPHGNNDFERTATPSFAHRRNRQATSDPQSATNTEVQNRQPPPSNINHRATLPPLASVLLAVWLIGAIVTAAPLAIGLLQTFVLEHRAREVDARDDRTWLTGLGSRLGLDRRVRLLETAVSIVPVTWGVLRPIVLFPASWRDWSDERRQIVLLHELAHVKRFDVAYQLLARLTCAAYWFHPLVWHALRCLRTERELACDDCVLSTGVRPSRYAHELVDMARTLHLPFSAAMVAMAQSTKLESRVRNMLDRAQSRVPLGRSAARILLATTVVIVTALAVVRLGARDVPEAFGSETSETSDLIKTDNQNTTANTDDTGLRYQGRVVDPDGNPVSGAKLYFTYYLRNPGKSMQPVATTDKAGKFDFEQALSDVEPEARSYAYFRSLVATADGFGFGIDHSIRFETTGKARARLNDDSRKYFSKALANKSGDLRLTKDLPIRGTILNSEGQPVVGAEVRIDRTWFNSDGTLDRWEAAALKPRADFYSCRRETDTTVNGPQLASVIPAVKTDEDGRFVVRGLGAERLGQFFLVGPGIEATELKVRTCDGQPVRLPTTRSHVMTPGGDIPKDTWHPAEFTHVAAPSRVASGRIVDADTGDPIPQVVVAAGKDFTFSGGGKAWLNTVTDDDGRYRLDGLAVEGEFQSIYVTAPTGSRYLPVVGRLGRGLDPNELTLDFTLRRGVMVRGKVLNSVTGEPVVGPVYYYADARNKNIADYPGFERNFRYERRTRPDGSFEIPVVPGKGILAFMADSHGQFIRGVGAEDITIRSSKAGFAGSGALQFSTRPGALHSTGVSFLREINVPSDLPLEDVVLRPVPSNTIIGTLIDPEGQPITTGTVAMESNGLQPSRFDNDDHRLLIEAYSPKQPRKFWLYHRERDLVSTLR